MGFELCTSTTSGIFLPASGAQLSWDNPFPCQYSPSAGRTTKFDSLWDTVDAARNAKQAATMAVHSCISSQLSVMHLLSALRKDRGEVETVLDKVQASGTKVSETSFDSIQVEVSEMFSVFSEAYESAANATKMTVKAFKAERECIRFMRVASGTERWARQVERLLEAELNKVGNQGKCEECVNLMIQGEKLHEERRDAALQSGAWASEARTYGLRCFENQRDVDAIRGRSSVARDRSILKAEEVMHQARKMYQGL